MRFSSKWIGLFSVLALALVGFVPVEAEANTRDGDSARSYYEKRFKVSGAEAERRLKMQADVLGALSVLPKALGAKIASARFDNREARWKFDVDSAANAGRVRAELDRHQVSVPVDVAVVGYGREELDAAVTRMRELVGVHSGGVSTKAGRVVVRTHNEKTFKSVSQIESLGRVPLEVIRVEESDLVADALGCSFPFCDQLVGGVGWWPVTNPLAFCSTGFAGTAGSFRVLFTAGHCIRNLVPIPEPWALVNLWSTCPSGVIQWWTCPAQGVISASRTFGPGGDYGMIFALNSVSNGIVDWNTNTIKPVNFFLDFPAPEDVTLCKSGSSSGTTCGVVEETDYQLTYDGVTVNGLIKMSNMCAIPGDSGGGTAFSFLGVQIAAGLAVATHMGEPCEERTTYIQPIHTALSGLGATLP